MQTPIEISLTTFIDYVHTAGTAKITVVRKAKRQYNEPYHPARDFWKILRDEIIRTHATGQPTATLTSILATIDNTTKHQHYTTLINAYKQWLGKKPTTWHGTNPTHWTHDQLRVNINPELGMSIKNNPHTIKLYFKNEPLAKARVQTILQLLNLTLPPSNNTIGLLDIRREKLHTATNNPTLDGLLKGEAASFCAVWNSIT